MGNEVNPFQDFLLQSLMFDVDISDTTLKSDINAGFVYILQNCLENANDVVYLDFEILNENNHFKVVGKNAVSALWLSGIFPKDVDAVLRDNILISGKKSYIFNPQTNELTIIEK